MFYVGYATVAYFTYNRKNKGNQLPIFLENHPPYTQNYIQNYKIIKIILKKHVAAFQLSTDGKVSK